MDVFDALNSSESLNDSQIQIEGFIALVSGRLCLIDSSVMSDFKNVPKIYVSNSDIMYAIRDVILPLGGGEGFIFHRSRIIGRLRRDVDLYIEIISLSIEKRVDYIYLDIDITENNISKMKIKYPNLIGTGRRSKSGDYMDAFE